MDKFQVLRNAVLQVAESLGSIDPRDHTDFPNESDWRVLDGIVAKLAELGITPNMHDAMKESDPDYKLRVLEWFAGDILATIHQRDKQAVNSWLNRVGNFT